MTKDDIFNKAISIIEEYNNRDSRLDELEIEWRKITDWHHISDEDFYYPKVGKELLVKFVDNETKLSFNAIAYYNGKIFVDIYEDIFDNSEPIEWKYIE